LCRFGAMVAIFLMVCGGILRDAGGFGKGSPERVATEIERYASGCPLRVFQTSEIVKVDQVHGLGLWLRVG